MELCMLIVYDTSQLSYSFTFVNVRGMVKFGGTFECRNASEEEKMCMLLG